MAATVDYSKALTIKDWADQSNEPAAKAIAKSVLQTVSILDDLKLKTDPSMIVRVPRITEQTIPTMAWGQINDGPTTIKTTVEPYEESLHYVREIIPIDRQQLRQKNWIDDPIQTQITGAMAGHVFGINDAFINGDPTTNIKSLIGLKYRVQNASTFGVASGLNIDAGVTMTTAMTQANALTWREKLAQAFAYLGSSDGEGCVAYCNWLSKERWARANVLGYNGLGFSIMKDQYDRQVEMFRKCKVVDLGFKLGNTSTPIISYTENASGVEQGGTTIGYTSIYIVKYDENHMQGWQSDILKPEYLGRSTETGVFENILFDWGMGIYHNNNRSFVRLYDIQLA
jgi:hypothetical protein